MWPGLVEWARTAMLATEHILLESDERVKPGPCGIPFISKAHALQIMRKRNPDLTANLAPTSRQAAMEDIMVELHDQALALWLWGYPLLHAVNNRVNFKLQGIERNTRFNEVTFNS